VEAVRPGQLFFYLNIMKKTFLAVFFLTAFVCPSYAQVTGGLKAGLNIANMHPSEGENPKARLGFHLGGYLQVPISEELSFQPEALYSSMGAKETFDDRYNDGFNEIHEKGEFVANLNYLSFPLLFAYKFGQVSLFAGPTLSFLLNAKGKYDVTVYVDSDEVLSESGSQKLKEAKDLDFGLNIGLGYDFGPINASARYYAGLSNVVDNDEGNETVKNGAFQISLGVKLQQK